MCHFYIVHIKTSHLLSVCSELRRGPRLESPLLLCVRTAVTHAQQGQARSGSTSPLRPSRSQALQVGAPPTADRWAPVGVSTEVFLVFPLLGAAMGPQSVQKPPGPWSTLALICMDGTRTCGVGTTGR